MKEYEGDIGININCNNDKSVNVKLSGAIGGILAWGEELLWELNIRNTTHPNGRRLSKRTIPYPVNR